MKNKNKVEQSTASLLRTPKAKNKLGLKVPTIALPHDDLIQAEKPIESNIEKSYLEIVPPVNNVIIQSTLPRQTTQTTQTSIPRQSMRTLSTEEAIAPSKNYQKVPNSITKLAIPEGLFVGKSKQLYDVLYGLTRGYITPTRKVRISKTKLMKQSGIGSRITFDSCISRLQTVGLLKMAVFPGEHEGNEFEIFLPEELSGLTSQSSQTSPAQKLDRLVSLETRQTSQSLNAADTTFYKNPKTIFKDFKIDDEEIGAFSEFIRDLSSACEKLTGEKAAAKDVNKWKLLGELLLLELEIAARRAGAISNVPAFLTEVLRRKLINQSVRLPKTGKVRLDTVGKNTTGEYEVKPLDEKEREATLAQLQEFASDDFLKEFEKWYTPEDWQWLMKQLENEINL